MQLYGQGRILPAPPPTIFKEEAYYNLPVEGMFLFRPTVFYALILIDDVTLLSKGCL